MIPNNASHLRITAAAGTKLAVASSGIPQRREVLAPIAWWSLTAVYTPRGFIPHAALLGQAFAHCPIFVTAASRRSLGSVSVPMRRANLSVPVPVLALVSRYLTNKLIGLGPLSDRRAPKGPRPLTVKTYASTASSGIILPFGGLSPCRRYVTQALLALSPLY